MEPTPLPGFRLEGEADNAFAIIGRFHRAARRADVPAEVISAVVAEATSGDYDHLLQTFIPWDSGTDEDW